LPTIKIEQAIQQEQTRRVTKKMRE
jgi:hypothetical protein